MQKTIKIDGMSCAHCANSVKVALEDIPGITNVDVNVRAGQATVEGSGFDDNDLKQAVEDEGYTVTGFYE